MDSSLQRFVCVCVYVEASIRVGVQAVQLDDNSIRPFWTSVKFVPLASVCDHLMAALHDDGCHGGVYLLTGQRWR